MTGLDGTVSVHLKPISGKTDQAGGVVFRAVDQDNFFVPLGSGGGAIEWL